MRKYDPAAEGDFRTADEFTYPHAGGASIVLAAAEAASLSRRAMPARGGRGAAASVVAYIFGIALLASPGNSLHAVIILLGIYLVVLGGLRVLHAAEAPNSCCSWKWDRLIHRRLFRNAYGPALMTPATQRG